jgi:hypothetical protein
MRTGGEFGADIIEWFNGGLFDSNLALPLDLEDIQLLIDVAGRDWSAIEPAIFGTLFERGLDPDKRTPLCANMTETSSVTAISEQGGKENQHGNDERFCSVRCRCDGSI